MRCERCLVVGVGSIGRRHARNLVSLGANAVTLYDVRPERAWAAAEELGVSWVSSVEEGYATRPDIVIVATPTHLHVEESLRALRAGCHLFVEKPLAHRETDLDLLCEEAVRRNLVTFVGYNMRFHPGPARVKGLVEEARIGRVLFGRFAVGSYMPDWRPGVDYRETYSSRAEWGGGCLLDCSHEIDLARWCMGEVRSLSAMAGRLGGLDIDVEDVAALICKHSDGSLSEIHLDYLQRNAERLCSLVGEEGTVGWNIRTGQIRWHGADGQWHVEDTSDGWELNQMYLDELRHFFHCVESGTPSCCTLEDGAAVARLALAARESARTSRHVEWGSAGSRPEPTNLRIRAEVAWSHPA